MVGGLKLTDMLAVSIAAQAALPALRLGLGVYDSFVGIVVHPGAVRVPRSHQDEDGVVHEYEEELSGEFVQGGPLMLSWPDVRAAGRGGSGVGPAYNVVIHEFAHVLDAANGEPDGVPPLPADLPRAEWQRSLDDEFTRFVARVDAGEDTALDPYAAHGPDEFFAVASESFFVDPDGLQAEHPAFYALLRRFDEETEEDEALDRVSDPEAKRKVIGELFIRIFEDAKAQVDDAKFLVQGTLYPDVIESGTKLGKVTATGLYGPYSGAEERTEEAVYLAWIGRFHERRGQWLAATLRFRNVIDTYQTTTHTPEALERLVEAVTHAPATLFNVRERGYLREGYFADLVIIDPDKPHTVVASEVLSRCAWTPFEGETFRSSITATFVNGQLAWNDGQLDDSVRGMRLEFAR